MRQTGPRQGGHPRPTSSLPSRGQASRPAGPALGGSCLQQEGLHQDVSACVPQHESFIKAAKEAGSIVKWGLEQGNQVSSLWELQWVWRVIPQTYPQTQELSFPGKLRNGYSQGGTNDSPWTVSTADLYFLVCLPVHHVFCLTIHCFCSEGKYFNTMKTFCLRSGWIPRPVDWVQGGEIAVRPSRRRDSGVGTGQVPSWCSEWRSGAGAGAQQCRDCGCSASALPWIFQPLPRQGALSRGGQASVPTTPSAGRLFLSSDLPRAGGAGEFLIHSQGQLSPEWI